MQVAAVSAPAVPENNSASNITTLMTMTPQLRRAGSSDCPGRLETHLQMNVLYGTARCTLEKHYICKYVCVTCMYAHMYGTHHTHVHILCRHVHEGGIVVHTCSVQYAVLGSKAMCGPCSGCINRAVTHDSRAQKATRPLHKAGSKGSRTLQKASSKGNRHAPGDQAVSYLLSPAAYQAKQIALRCSFGPTVTTGVEEYTPLAGSQLQ